MLCPMPGNSGTPKARALGNALRVAREAHNLSLRAFAEKIGKSPSTLSRWELGERAPEPTDVAQILGQLGVNGEQYDEILALARGAGDPLWVAVSLPEQQQQLAALLALERTAKHITEVSPLLIPGLLQTSEYIRAIMSGGSVPPGEIDTRVAVRRGRRDALERTDPVHLLALIGETALRQMIGGAEVMRGQLQHLRKAAAMQNVDLRIVPFTADWHPALEGPFGLIESGEGTVVQVENRRSGLFLHEPEDVAAYREAADAVLQVAMSPEQSSELIAEAIHEMG